MFDMTFYNGKNVFVTGHTGFKGSWLCKMLVNAGAKVTGYSLEPTTNPSLFNIANIANDVESIIGDIRDYKKLKAAFDKAQPEIVFHLAAQPIVRDSYKDPAYTYETNVMGTVNILECVRNSNCVRSFLNVTTDKVYLNKEWSWGYRENEELDGFDPYSNSKSCSELVTASYKRSFFENKNIAISTARAGNVIGGGDFANDRIIISNMFYTPKCGDVIVISRNYNNEHTDVSMSSEPIIKRVIATEGMVVDIDFENGYVYVDGTLLKEDYIKNPTVTKWDVEFPLTVGKNQLFVLGDNRMESMDSRDSRIGLIDERYVLGKALFRVYRDAEHRSSFSEMFGGI